MWRHRSWAHFTANNSSMLMQVWWKFHSAIVGFSMKVITVKFCTRHDSCTVVACVKFCSDMVPNYRVTQKPQIFPGIWITAENPPWNGPVVQHWFRQWLVSWLPQPITWTTVDYSGFWHSPGSWVTTCNVHIIQQICFRWHRSWVSIFQ